MNNFDATPKFPGVNPNWLHLMSLEISGQATVQFPTQYDMVRMFHVLADVPLGTVGEVIPESDIVRRMRLITEEVVMELLPELELLKKDQSLEQLAKVLDGCVDAVYVIMGTCAELGLPFDSAFAMIQESNIAKVKDVVVKREDGKVLKPEGWQSPPLFRLIQSAYAKATTAANQGSPDLAPPTH